MAKKVLFINQEILPYVPETVMSSQGRNLPQSIQESGCEIRTFMPKWGIINKRRGQLHEVIRLSGMNIIIDDTDHPLIISVATIPSTRIQVYFIDNEDYFMKRQMTVDEKGVEYVDNGERAIFFARGVLETVKKLRWTPDVIHCQGWISALVPYYIKTAYKYEPSFCNTKIVTSLFKNDFDLNLGNNFKDIIDFKEGESQDLSVFNEKSTYEELAKLAIMYSDGIVEAQKGIDTTLVKYAKEQGKHIMKHNDAKMPEAYMEFYEKIVEEDK